MDTYDTGTADINSLPPLTKALREVWNPLFGAPNNVRAGIEPVPVNDAMRKILDAINALETRVTALETP